MKGLFLGLAIDPLFSNELEKNAKEFNQLFISSEYLQEIEHKGIRYLGKSIENEVSLKQLELLEAHIFSLLKKIVKNYPYEGQSLCLLNHE